MIEIRPLRPSDNRTGFCSGNPDLDRFFLRYAGQNQFRHHIGTTYVAVSNGTIKGFATISASSIEIEHLPAAKKINLPQYPLPVLRLARLAVDRTARGQGLGHNLLRAVFVIASEMSRTVGCTGVVVDAKPEAVSFYTRFGFERIEFLEGALADRPLPVSMFLPIGTIKAAIKGSFA
jgi:GNAT superfamily N-acetyltransferase